MPASETKLLSVRLPEATLGLSAELARRWLRSWRALRTASRFWKLPRSSDSPCNSSLPSFSSRPRAPRLPLPVADRTHQLIAHLMNRFGLYQGTTFSRAEQGVAKDPGFSPCEIRTQGLKPGFLGAEQRH